MKLRIMSDIHLEFFRGEYPQWLEQENDVLILAGDITVGPSKLQQLLTRLANLSRHVIYVFGNHEYYGYNLASYDSISVPSNVHILNPGTVCIDGVVFAGAALWTDFRNNPNAELIARRYIADFKRIKGDFDILKLHAQHTKFLNDNPADVVITHFLPGEHCVSPKWIKLGQTDYNVYLLNYYFAGTTQTANPKLWIFGHTHDAIDITRNNTRFISNPYGYHQLEISTQNFNPNLEVAIV